MTTGEEIGVELHVNATYAPARRATPWGTIASLVAALLYGVSPIDLIPDIIPLLGLVDDAGVIGVLVIVAISLWRRSRRATLRR